MLVPWRKLTIVRVTGLLFPMDTFASITKIRRIDLTRKEKIKTFPEYFGIQNWGVLVEVQV